MRTRRLRLTLLAGLLYYAAIQAPSQSLQVIPNEQNTGFPENTLHLGTKIDDVQINNGNLHIDIPYLSVDGRGIKVTGHFVYDSKSWAPVLTCSDDGSGCYANIEATGNTSFYPFIDQDSYSVSYGYGTGYCTDGSNDQVAYTYLSGVYVVDGEGTKHPFPTISPWVAGVDPRAGGLNCPDLMIGPDKGYASDGSGWYLDFTGFDNYPNGKYAAYRRDGSQVFNYTNADIGVPGAGTPFSLKDTNGNYIGYGPLTSQNGTVIPDADQNVVVDTMGRAFTLNGSPGYYDSAGAFQGVSIQNEPVSIQTSGCSTIYLTDPTQGTSCYEFSDSSDSLPHIIQMPNGQTYTINYVQNSYGQPSSITLPTGATINYTWSTDVDSGGPILQSRTETVNGVSSTWTYQLGGGGCGIENSFPPMETISSYIGKVTDPLGNDTTYTCANDKGYMDTYISDVKFYNGSAAGGTLLKTLHTDWTMFYGGSTAEPISTTTTLNDTGLVSRAQTDWETISEPQTMFGDYQVGGNFSVPTGNKTETREYGFGQGTPGVLLRTTDYRYLHQDNPSTYIPLNILDRPTQITVTGSTGIVAQTINSYDTTPVLSANTTAPNHDPSYSTSFADRGNLTQVRARVDANTSIVTKTNTYDLYGNLRKSQDANGNTTWFGYDDNYVASSNGTCFSTTGDAQGYVTNVTNAKNQVTTYSYYPCPGLLASTTDPNGAVTSQTYDTILAPLVTTYPDSGTLTRNYNGYSLPLTVTTSLPGIANSAVAKYDGMGRISHYIAPNGATTDTTYDSMGRIGSVSNPYLANTDSTYGITLFNYDPLNRKVLEVESDGVSKIHWSYSGNCASETDEIGNQWTRCDDALGRLTNVVEPGGAQTSYAYDALGNLLSVTQNGTSGETPRPQRTYTYDSLSRLMTAFNPESGTVTYSYPSGGTLCAGEPSLPCSKSDSRGSATTYTYDTLNRLLSKTYSGGSAATTASSCYQYDTDGSSSTNSNLVGRLVNEWTIPSTTTCTATLPANGYLTLRSILGYDAMGRVEREQQCHLSHCTSGVPYENTSDYDLAGNLTSFTSNVHSIGFVYSYDAAGRLLNLGSALVDSTHPGSLLSIGSYTPAGAIQSMTLGPNINVTKTYDNRLRVTGETAQHP